MRKMWLLCSLGVAFVLSTPSLSAQAEETQPQATEESDPMGISVSVGPELWWVKSLGDYEYDGFMYGGNASIGYDRYTLLVGYTQGSFDEEYQDHFTDTHEPYTQVGTSDRQDLDIGLRVFLGAIEPLNSLGVAGKIGYKRYDYSGDYRIIDINNGWWWREGADFACNYGAAGLHFVLPLGNPDTTPVSLDASVNGLLGVGDGGYAFEEDMSGEMSYGVNGSMGLSLQIWYAYLSGGWRGQYLKSAGTFYDRFSGLYIAGGFHHTF